MQLTRLIGPTICLAFGFFTLWQGIDCLKVEHFGLRLVTVEWFARVTTLSYHQAGICWIVLGLFLMGAGRGMVYFSSIPERLAVPAILVAVVLGFTGCAIANLWFPTHI